MALPQPEDMPIALPVAVADGPDGYPAAGGAGGPDGNPAGGEEGGGGVQQPVPNEELVGNVLAPPEQLRGRRRRSRQQMANLRRRSGQNLVADVDLFSETMLDVSDTVVRRQVDDVRQRAFARDLALRDLLQAALNGNEEAEAAADTVRENNEEENTLDRLQLQRTFIALFAYSGTCLRALPLLQYALDSTLRTTFKFPLVLAWLCGCFQNSHVARQLLTDERAAPVLRWISENGAGAKFVAVAAVELLTEGLFALRPAPVEAAAKEVVATTTDDSLVWMLQRLLPAAGEPQSEEQADAIMRLRSWLVAGTHGEDSFGGRVMPMTKTKQFLAPYFRRANLAQLQQLAREQAQARCGEMQVPGNPRCRNEEGNLSATPWCDVPAWAYFRDVDGYCYDIRELLTQLASHDPYLPEPQPTYAFTRRPIEATDIYSWAVKAAQRGWHVPLPIARMLAAYALSGPAANVTRPYGRYDQLVQDFPFLERDVQDKWRANEFFNPSTPEAYRLDFLAGPNEQEELPAEPPALVRGVGVRGPSNVIFSEPPALPAAAPAPAPAAAANAPSSSSTVPYSRRRLSTGSSGPRASSWVPVSRQSR